LRVVPDVMVRKRIGDRLAATVTTDLTDERNVRGSVLWQLGRSVWVEALWENVAPVPVSAVGDFGVGLRYRVEFR
ncbi:MAG TPA: hypothetical protein VE987_02595, partial [Polyangiaceae bacterium]|nr:hypothetical protein [Polyangiaceae bacterium]